MNKKFEQLKQCKTLGELTRCIPEPSTEKASFFLLAVVILSPILWLPALYTKLNLGILDIIYVTELMRIVVIMFAGMHMLWRFGRKQKSFREKLRELRITSPWVICFIALLIIIFLSCILSSNRAVTFSGDERRQEGFWQYLMYAGLFYLASQVKKPSYRLWLYRLFFGIGILAALAFTLQFTDIWEYNQPDSGYWNPTGWFENSNHYGYFVTLTIFAAGLLFCLEKGWVRILYLLVEIFFVWTMILNNTCGALVACTFAIVVGIVLLTMANRPLLKRFLVFTGMYLAVCVMVTLLPEESLGSKNIVTNIEGLLGNAETLVEADLESEEGMAELDYIGSSRFRYWRQAIDLITENPALGLGPDQGKIIMREGSDDYNTRPANEYLYLGMTFGVLGGLLYLAGLILGLIYQWKQCRSLHEITLCSAVLVVGYCISAFFGNSVFIIYPYFMIFLAFALSGRSDTSENRVENGAS